MFSSSLLARRRRARFARLFMIVLAAVASSMVAVARAEAKTHRAHTRKHHTIRHATRKTKRAARARIAVVHSSSTTLVAPKLAVQGTTLTWSKVDGTSSYVLATIVDGNTSATTYQTVNGTSFTPAARPGHSVNYGLRANLTNAPWSAEVTISYPSTSTSTGTTTTTTTTSSGTTTTASTTTSSPTTATTTTAVSPAATVGSVEVGLNGSNWGPQGAADIAGSFKWDRLDTSMGASPSDYAKVGVKVDVLISGTCPTCDYSTGGVSSINPTTWASDALAWYQAHCTADTCPELEVLNEPGNPYFWGANAGSQANANAYAVLLKVTYNTFHNALGTGSPKLLGSFDGGYEGAPWGTAVWGNTAGVSVNSFVDGVTVHPYGGLGSGSALGNRTLVAAAHTATGKAVYVTEVGWPTDCTAGCPTSTNNTGDSLQWSETSQAANIYNFVAWAQSTGYVADVLYFNYRDYGTTDWYGLERWGEGGSTVDGSKKPGWTALAEAAAGQVCTVC